MKFFWLGSALLGALLLVGAGCSFGETTNESVNLNLEPLAPQTTSAPVNAAGEVQGLQVLEEEIALTDVTPAGDATGIAQRMWDGKNFSLVLSVSLPKVPDGATPVAWLMSQQTKKTVRLGDLTQQLENAWSLTVESPTDYSSYESIVISANNSEDTEPTEKILEGKFDQTLRPIGE
jgi:hypothetical protein